MRTSEEDAERAASEKTIDLGTGGKWETVRSKEEIEKWGFMRGNDEKWINLWRRRKVRNGEINGGN